MKRSAFVWAAALIVLGAAFLRLADLRTMPPGLHYDEAADMLLSRDIAFYGYAPFPVVTAYSGREALFYYLAAPLIGVLGPEIYAARLTSALLGIVAVAGCIAAGRALFKNYPHAAGIALMAGGFFAVNGAQVWLSRQGFRTSPQPMLEALSLWLLFVALNRINRRRGGLFPALIGGVLGGLTVYVYMAARIFPPYVAVLLGAAIVLIPTGRGQRLKIAAVYGAAMAITAAPIALFYAQNPAVFLDRLAQVATGGVDTQTPTLIESIGLHLRMWFIEGDPLLRYNLYPGRPFFDPITGVLMLIGLIAAAGAALRGSGGGRLAGLALILAPILIAPSVVAVSGLPPSHMRSVAVVPLAFFWPAWGAYALISLTRFLTRRIPPLSRVAQSRVGLIPPLARGRGEAGGVRFALILILALNTWHDYRTWAARPDVFYDADGDLQLAARWLTAHAAPDDLIYLSSRYYEHPTVLAHAVNPAQIRWQMEDHLFVAPPRRPALYIFPRSVDSGYWQELLAPFAVPDLPIGPDGLPAFAAYRLTVADSVPLPRVETPANFDGQLFLRRTDFPTASGGQHAAITVWWDMFKPPTRDDLTAVFILRGADGAEISRAMPYMEYTGRWQPGESLVQRVRFTLPYSTQPEQYSVGVQWIAKNAPGTYLALKDGRGRFAGLEKALGTWAIAGAAPGTQPAPAGLAAIGSGVLAAPIGPLPAQAEQGEWLSFAVMWYATQAPGDLPAPRLTADQGAESRLLWTDDPRCGELPFAAWQAGEAFTARCGVQIPLDFPPGAYTLRYRVGEQVVFESALEIAAAERLFAAPPLDQAVDVPIGDSLRLVGYRVAVTGNQARVTVALQARGIPPEDYTLTVQSLSPDGRLFGQQDAPPPRPTRRLIDGEVIVAEYVVNVPDGPYSLILAVYRPADGQRLPTPDGDTVILRPLTD